MGVPRLELGSGQFSRERGLSILNSGTSLLDSPLLDLHPLSGFFFPSRDGFHWCLEFGGRDVPAATAATALST